MKKIKKKNLLGFIFYFIFSIPVAIIFWYNHESELLSGLLFVAGLLLAMFFSSLLINLIFKNKPLEDDV